MADNVLLSIVISPSIEDAFVDLLLEHDAVSGFTSFAVNGHGVSVHSLTPAEQVAGHQRQRLFQTYLPQPQAHELIDNLKQHFAGSGIHYWMIPLVGAGRVA